ncbi:MFS transporter [Microbulbifer sp. EKSA005]|uniref:MFS transporter n=1 Tax=Microbulbifer sp. EKSA005 TaxID=3243364 RepID=UPI004040F388
MKHTTSGIPSQSRITLLCLAALTIMSGATVAPSLPALQQYFSGTPNSDLWSRLVVTLPALSIALCAPLAGWIADRHGRLQLLKAALVLYGLSGLLALFQDSLAGILTSRLLLGVAVAGTMTSVTALVGDYFSREQRLTYLSQQSTFISIGGVVFLTLGGLLASLHWRAPFAIYLLALLLVPAVKIFLWEPMRVRPFKHRDPKKEKQDNPLAFYTLLAAATLNSLAFTLIPTQIPFYLREIEISSPSLIAMAIASSNVMGAIASLLIYRRARNRLGVLGVFIASFTIMAASFGLLAGAQNLTEIVAFIALYGLGMGTLIPHIFSTALESAPESKRGKTAGFLTTGIFLGQFISPFISQPWIDKMGYSSAFSSMALILMFAASSAALIYIIKIKKEFLLAYTSGLGSGN